MKLNFFKVVGICVIALTISMNCFAIQMPDIEYKYKDSKVIVSGDALENEEFVTLQILKADKSFCDSHTADDTLFCDQVSVDENGKYTFEVEYDFDLSTDEYAMRVASVISKETKNVILVKYDDFAAAYSKLIDAVEENDDDTFEDTINGYRKELNFAFSLTDDNANLSINDELKDYYKYIKDNELKIDAESKNTAIFKTYMTAYYLNSNKLENIDSVIDELYCEDAQLFADYNYIAETDARQKYLTKKMSSMDIADLNDFKTALIKAVILTQTYYADGPGDVKDIFEKYGSVIGITDTASNDVYTDLAGIDFENCSELVEKYEDLQEEPDKGNSSFNGKPNSFKGDYTIESIEKEESEKPQTIRMSFDDLDGVAWASEAILALADKGIVNGKGDRIFAPDDNVTREEFAKILVGAMGLDKGQAVANEFADVKENEWYARSVNIAKNAGIVNGIGGGKFGIGMPITREDMVVMIYNALKNRNVSMTIADLAFSDATIISEYALNAVGALYQMGAVNGVSETEFAPKGIASRAQAAKIIYGVLKYLQ